MSKSRNCVHEYRRVDVNDYHRQRICNLCGRIENWMPDQYGNWQCDPVTCPHLWTNIHDSRECEWCGEVQRLVSTQYTKGECKPIDTWKTIKKVTVHPPITAEVKFYDAETGEEVCPKRHTCSCKCEQSTAETQCHCEHDWIGHRQEGDRIVCGECGEEFEVVTEDTVERKLVWRALRAEKSYGDTTKAMEECEKTEHRKRLNKLITVEKRLFDMGKIRDDYRDDNQRLRKTLTEVRDENKRLTQSNMDHHKEIKELKEKVFPQITDDGMKLWGKGVSYWFGLERDYSKQEAQLEKGRKEYKELEAKFEEVCKLHMHELNERIKAQDNNGEKAVVISNLRYLIRELENERPPRKRRKRK